MAVLSISRQFGAGGKTLGQRVAQRLGYEFVDEGLLLKVAEEANVSIKWVEGVQREAGGRLMRILTSLVPSTFIDRHLGESGSDFDEKRYVEFLTRIILDLAEEDNVVLLGRGSQFILRQHPDTMRVLLVAERADRIKFMEGMYNMPPDKAEAMVTRESRKRERFLANFHKGDPNDPSLYHMVLNTSLVHLEAAEEQIAELVLGAVDASAEPIWD
ncbi:MAG: cytidylate kinase-like family protein [Desulfarculaceae bacterium]|nr:cytidylate kinase-like family protein [Desulfarculaceae bacterium]MCF8072999.1 cytidylate kinase-like family protein [Desulfarculaceae bacterium]MCF8100705.1 cytidylate kinase-like family protein [Desulfarculaceae bacterium]MCF8115443.1 cytidylate kinase-like family protein [Desulfarculaceae bacterium]